MNYSKRIEDIEEKEKSIKKDAKNLLREVIQNEFRIMEDAAKAAGVSKSYISHVLAGSTPAKMKKILDLARKMLNLPICK